MERSATGALTAVPGCLAEGLQAMGNSFFTLYFVRGRTGSALIDTGISAMADGVIGQLDALGVRPDNLEAMAFGPRLPNGNPTLLLMSDDNFSAAGGSPQVNQFILLEIVAP